MIRVRHYGGAEWGVESSAYSENVRVECRSTPGMRWSPEHRAWVGYVDAVDAAVLRLEAKGLRIFDRHLLPDPTKPGGPVLAPIADTDLRDYQKSGVRFLVGHAAEGAMLADEMGLGKTVQALRAARALRGRTIIVVPNFVKSVWATGIVGDKTLDPPTPPGWPGAKTIILKGTGATLTPPDPTVKLSKIKRDVEALAAQLRKPSTVDVVIINYDILYAWVEVLMAWEPKTLIFDEAHMLMGDRARRTRAAEQLAKVTPNRILLSATPMTSRPRDLWAPVNVLSEGRFGVPFAFYKRHCAAFQERVSAERVVWNTKGASDLDELNRRLSFFMLRRTIDEVGMQLPPRTRQMIEVDVEKRFQLSMAVALQNDESLRRALDMAADGKLNEVASLVMSHCTGDNKVVVGTWRKVVAEGLANALRAANVDARVITGDVSEKNRKAVLAAQPQVICATLDSMGVGLDLSFANVGICAELHYVPSKLVQWEGRLHRFRQKRPTLFQYVIARGTADELIRDMVIKKMHTFKEGVGKSSDGLMDDLEGGKRTPTEVLRGLFERMQAKQKANPNAEIDDD